MTLKTLTKVWTFCVRAALEITKLECLNEVTITLFIINV